MAGVQKKFDMKFAVGAKSKGGKTPNETPAHSDYGKVDPSLVGSHTAPSAARASQAVGNSDDKNMDARGVPGRGGIPQATNDPVRSGMDKSGVDGIPKSIDNGSSSNGKKNDTMQLPHGDAVSKFRKQMTVGIGTCKDCGKPRGTCDCG